MMSPDLNRDLSRKEGLRGQPRQGVDSNVSAWSQLSVAAVTVHTAVSPGICTPTRRFQEKPSQGGSFVSRGLSTCVPSSRPLPYRPRGFGTLSGLSSLSDTSPWSTRYSYVLLKFVPASPGVTLLFPCRSEPVVTHRVGLCIGDARQQSIETAFLGFSFAGFANPFRAGLTNLLYNHTCSFVTL
jgi:hypothetical protein